MVQPQFTVACVATDRSRPLARGDVDIRGCTLNFLFAEPEDIFRRALREKAFEITEMSMASHIVTTARGDSSYIGVPVFLSRSFRHSGVFVRTDRGIKTLGDLKGRVVGVPEYQQTAAMWVRGMMLDEFGVSAADISWRVGGMNEPGPGERIKLDLPDTIDARAITGQQTLNGMLAAGEIDAIISPRPPLSLDDDTIPVDRLFVDTRQAEAEYFARTGYFPIMHCLAVRRDVADAHPWLPGELFRSFSLAKAQSLRELSMTNVLRVSLPWIVHEYRAAAALADGNPWPYGFERNRQELDAMTRYAATDGIASRKVDPEELFHPSTYDLKDTV